MNNPNAKLRVLCVDDQVFMLRTLMAILRKEGFENCQFFSNPMEALAKLTHERFDLIITDLQMDQLNGLELIKAIRTDETACNPQTPILVMSGLAEAHIIKKAWLLDVSSFILKPHNPKTVRDKIAECLSKNEATKAPEDYRLITTSLMKQDLYQEQSDPAPEPSAPQMRTFENCPIYAIPRHAILQEDVHTREGVLLFEADTCLDRELLVRVQEAAHAHGIEYLNVRVEPRKQPITRAPAQSESL